MRKLVVIEGPDVGAVHELEGDGPFTMGREKSRDFVIQDDRASRLHAVLAIQDGMPVITDRGSSNGTFVNGALVRTQALRDGDVIDIGKVRLQFQSSEDAAGVSGPEVAAPARPIIMSGEATVVLPDAESLGEQAPLAEPRDAMKTVIPGSSAAPRTDMMKTVIPAGPGEASGADTVPPVPPVGAEDAPGTARAVCDPGEIIATVVDSAMPLAEEAGVDLAFSGDRLKPLAVEANALYQSLAAVLGGALKCVRSGARVQIAAEQTAAGGRLSIVARVAGVTVEAAAIEEACGKEALARVREFAAAHGGIIAFGAAPEDAERLFVLQVAP